MNNPRTYTLLEQFLLWEAEQAEEKLLQEMRKLSLDNSQIRCFLECQKKYQFRHVWGLTRGMEPWLVTGRAWGAAQDQIWKGEGLSRAVEAFERTVQEELPNLSEEGTEDWRIAQRHHYHEALADYLSTYENWIRNTFDPERTVFEQFFEIELPSCPPAFLTGLLDKLVFNCAEETWWVVEHKTTGMVLTHAYLNKWSNDQQIKTYGFVGRRLWGERFGGVLVDCVSISRRGRIALQMLPITVPPQVGGEWEADTIGIAEAIADRRAGRARFVRTSDACERFGRVCEYFDACAIGADPREELEAWGMQVEFWDPQARCEREPLRLKSEEEQNA